MSSKPAGVTGAVRVAHATITNENHHRAATESGRFISRVLRGLAPDALNRVRRVRLIQGQQVNVRNGDRAPELDADGVIKRSQHQCQERTVGGNDDTRVTMSGNDLEKGARP